MAIKRTDPMVYQKGMEIIASDILDKVLKYVDNYDYLNYSKSDVKQALIKEHLSLEDYGALLSPAATPYLEEMAKKAVVETRKHFGNSICLFTPLYIANYCENNCVYCGFNCKNKIRRGKLSIDEMEAELKAIAKTGLKEILIL
ncbi:MAG: 2-iminoacetate synthase ThiH, partial [Acetobacterium sp.]|nr:2-iminoacetate synthase ThiH [Acetobacterium sp.]